MLKSQRVQDAVGMQAAFNKQQWDVVVSEHTVNHFGAQMALDLLKREGIDVPVIVLAKKIADADMVKIMRAGARDVVHKQQVARLLPVVERELQVARERSNYQKTATTIKEVEEKHRVLVAGAREAICYSHEGMHIDANPAYLHLFGYERPEDLEGIPVLNMIDGKDHARLKEMFRKAVKEKEAVPAQEFLAVKMDGTRFAVEIAIAAIMLRGEKCHQVNVVDISQRKTIENKLHFLNQRDPLTGLYNRHAFLQELSKVVDKAKSGAANSALIYIDVDQLRDINDNIGHAVGDRLLIMLARLFRDKAREQDVVARFGGDEFMLLMADVSKVQAQAVADAIVKALKEASFSEAGRLYECNCSLSLTTIDKTSESIQKVLGAASAASAEIKSKKRAAAEPPPPPPPPAPPPPLAEPSPVESAAPAARVTAATAAWTLKIQQALDNQRLQIKFQPIINLHAEPEENYEVLLRISGADNISIRAAEFIRAAEESGQIVILDHKMLERAIDALTNLHKTGRRTNFFVNLSAASLGDPEVPLLVQRMLADTGLSPRALVFQVNENAVVSHAEQLPAFIKAIKRLNCRLALDDFNACPESIRLLRNQPFDFITITGALVSDLASDQVCQVLVEAMVGVAKNLEKLVIAKHVEDAQSLSLLWNYGVHYVQGNYFQQPESELNYEFAGETISSDHAVAGWVTAGP
jgi:diguanylate cyclase (GGDEF)-like protein/PAS domain S-box-containing protein